ncbi:MAG: hypothetical protein OXG56_07910 [Gammaproteobacteria bacterium]|nr:hypothetical protein [Gammaproteobacteria bacterium]
MMKETSMLSVFYHSDFLQYRIPAGVFDGEPSDYLDLQIDQPEGPERIRNTKGVLERTAVSGQLEWRVPHAASDEELSRFHTREYIERLKEFDLAGDYVSQSTYLPKGGLHTVRLSAGAAIGAARQVLAGTSRMAYAISRPPSHHAQPGEADGYCFINGVGLATLEAIREGCRRVAVIDWDVHHGNGTQVGFYGRDDVLTISLHMDHGAWGPTHVQTGDVDEIGEGRGEGYNINLPIPFGAGDYCYNRIMECCVVPAVTEFNPDFIVLANGQDANQFDPNGRQCVTMAGYYQLALQVRELARAHCGGRLVMTQEGGYNPTYAPYCAYSVVCALLAEEPEIADPISFYPEDAVRADRDVEALIARHPLF